MTKLESLTGENSEDVGKHKTELSECSDVTSSVFECIDFTYPVLGYDDFRYPVFGHKDFTYPVLTSSTSD